MVFQQTNFCSFFSCLFSTPKFCNITHRPYLFFPIFAHTKKLSKCSHTLILLIILCKIKFVSLSKNNYRLFFQDYYLAGSFCFGTESRKKKIGPDSLHWQNDVFSYPCPPPPTSRLEPDVVKIRQTALCSPQASMCQYTLYCSKCNSIITAHNWLLTF